MIEFKLGEHTISRGNAMLEIWRDGVFVAGIFPREDRLKIVSTGAGGNRTVCSADKVIGLVAPRRTRACEDRLTGVRLRSRTRQYL